MKRDRVLLRLAVVLAAAVAVMAGTAVAAAPADATQTGCWVKNVRTQVTGSNLQAAVLAANAGDSLKIRGICGPFEATQDLTLLGPATLARPTCEQCGSGMMGIVSAGKVTLKDLVVSNGSSTYYGGGLHNYGTLVLRGTTSVRANLAEDGGGGIYNEGLLVMRDTASVTGNTLVYNGYGGGIWNRGTVVMNDQTIVSGNAAGLGGGIYNSGKLIMRGSSSVTGNSAETGGGISNEGTVTFGRYWHGTVCGNEPDDWPRCGPCAPRTA